MTETRLGIIGLGGFGVFCLDKCRYIPGVQITALADINAELVNSLGEQFGVPYTTSNWRELIARRDVDVVHIATPPSLHVEQGLAAIENGKHVFCEKPLAISLEEADALLSAAEQHRVRVGIDFVMRYNTLYDAVRTITEERLLGAPQRFVFENTAKDLPAGHWFWDPWLSGGIPVEHGVHFFDIFASIFGPGKIQWAGRTTRTNGAEDKWLAVLQYGEQMFGSFYHAFAKPYMIERTWAEIDFEYGSIRLEGWIPERLTLLGVGTGETLSRIAAIIPTAVMTPLEGDETVILVNGREESVTHRITAERIAGAKTDIYGNAVQQAMADFVLWTKDPQHRPRITGKDSREALRVAIEVERLAREAAESGQGEGETKAA